MVVVGQSSSGRRGAYATDYTATLQYLRHLILGREGDGAHCVEEVGSASVRCLSCAYSILHHAADICVLPP